MEKSLLSYELREATLDAVGKMLPSRVILEYRSESGGQALSISLGTDLFQRLVELHAGKDKARQWLQARLREVADLSPSTIEHYLNFVIKQQLCIFPEEYPSSERLEVMPLCVFPLGARTGFCAHCALSRDSLENQAPGAERISA
ncbi:hypothetical protein [Acidithiobacillus sp. AMEEHan]|uniref:hypothetical protein n=1 Tax=Acidithiobacillus sp. AMEEHan TaxID=2994951 RepID=UPI0027E41320|nr:hypothetical protein [Acidithiobacillus sp. AMEEHan]